MADKIIKNTPPQTVHLHHAIGVQEAFDILIINEEEPTREKYFHILDLINTRILMEWLPGKPLAIPIDEPIFDRTKFLVLCAFHLGGWPMRFYNSRQEEFPNGYFVVGGGIGLGEI